MEKIAREIAAYIKKNSKRRFRIISHIDADGITSAAISSIALDRLKIPHYIEFVKQLDESKIMELRKKFGLEFYEVDMLKYAKNQSISNNFSNNNSSYINSYESEKADGGLSAHYSETAKSENRENKDKVGMQKPIMGEVKFDISNEEKEIVWFTDLGSGLVHLLDGMEVIVTDHHVPSTQPVPNYAKIRLEEEVSKRAVSKVPKEVRKDLLLFTEAYEDAVSVEKKNLEMECKDGMNDVVGVKETSRMPEVKYHLNPHLFGYNGAHAISGAGCTYLVARALDEQNRDLSALAIVGAVGDLQDSEHRKLLGINEEIISDGIKCGVISKNIDIRLFGRETRPVFKLLEYANDPILPGITGSETSSISFLVGLGIPLKENEKWLRWIDLSEEDKRKIISNLITILLIKGFGYKTALRLVGEVYVLNKEKLGSELHDAKEYATLLNSCGRYEQAEVGFRVCKGDREEYYEKAKVLLQGHRKTLVDMMQIVKEIGIEKREYLQYFHGKDLVLDNIVGIVASMLLGSGEIDRSVPIFGFAYSSDGLGVKVSARGDHAMVEAGLNLSLVMQKSSEKVGGVGGGHNVAAGALIPMGKEEEFLQSAEIIIKEQMKRKNA